ncbi:hypothetical protein CTI14_55025, partial [Methylobacterium radiotolerans]
GPLIDMAAVEKTEAHIRDAVEKGARVVAGGHRHALNSGQTCICTNRFLVQDGSLRRLRGEDGRGGQPPEGRQRRRGRRRPGPLIDMAAVEKTEAHIRDAVEKGARVVAGGHRH